MSPHRLRAVSSPISRFKPIDTPRNSVTFGREAEFIVYDALFAVDPDATSRMTGRGYSAPEFNNVAAEHVSPILTLSDLRENELRALVELNYAVQACGNGRGYASLHSVPVAQDPRSGITDKERYRDFLAAPMASMSNTPIGGSHYHANFDSMFDRVRAHSHLVGFEHILVAVAAASPFCNGFDTHHQSERVRVFNSLPTVVDFAPTISDENPVASYFSQVRNALSYTRHDDPTKLHAYTRVCFSRDDNVEFSPKEGKGQPTLEIRSPDNAINVDRAVFQDLLIFGLMSSVAERLEKGTGPAAQIADPQMRRNLRFVSAQAGMTDVLYNPFVDSSGYGTFQPAQQVVARAVAEARRGLTRLAKLEGVDSSGLIRGFNAMWDRVCSLGGGAEQVRAMHDSIHAAQKARGVEVADLDAFHRGQVPMAKETSTALMASLEYEQLAGSLMGSKAQDCAILAKIKPFEGKPGLEADVTGLEVIETALDSLQRDYPQALEDSGVLDQPSRLVAVAPEMTLFAPVARGLRPA